MGGDITGYSQKSDIQEESAPTLPPKISTDREMKSRSKEHNHQHTQNVDNWKYTSKDHGNLKKVPLKQKRRNNLLGSNRPKGTREKGAITLHKREADDKED